MRFWIAFCILVATASFEGGYILAKTQDTWGHEFKYTQLNTRLLIVESKLKEGGLTQQSATIKPQERRVK